MNSSVTKSFLEEFARLPAQVQRQARKQYLLWQRDPRHPSLHFKKVGKYWSARIDDNFRVVGRLRDGTLYWFALAPHTRYERLIND